MGEERSNKDSFDLKLIQLHTVHPEAVHWMHFPTSSQSLRNSFDGSYVTLIRSSAFRQSSCTEYPPHLGCLLWNIAALQKWITRLQFFPRLEVKIAGRSWGEGGKYRSCGKLSAVFWLSSTFMPLCDARSFGCQIFHSHVLVLLLFEIPEKCLGIGHMSRSLI